MANLPSVKPHCPLCKSENLKVDKRVVGEGIYRRAQTWVVCLSCGEDLWMQK